MGPKKIATNNNKKKNPPPAAAAADQNSLLFIPISSLILVKYVTNYNIIFDFLQRIILLKTL